MSVKELKVWTACTAWMQPRTLNERGAKCCARRALLLRNREQREVRGGCCSALPVIATALRLQAFLHSKGVNTTGMFEKAEMVEAALAHL